MIDKLSHTECVLCGSCIDACPTGAISFQKEYLDFRYPAVNTEKCVGCGACAAKCPKKIIELVPESKTHVVACSNHQTAKEVKEVCKVGCLGCTLCSKKCPEGAITMEENLPVIDYEKCTNCGTCAESCRFKVIS